MVPMLTCGLVLSNFFFAIFLFLLNPSSPNAETTLVFYKTRIFYK
jgi:hypothetical protein